MLKKCLILALSLAAFSFAQDAYAPAPSDEVQYEDVSAYTSGAPAPETPVVNINEVPSSDPIFFVSVHPISMLFGCRKTYRKSSVFSVRPMPNMTIISSQLIHPVCTHKDDCGTNSANAASASTMTAI